MPVLPKLLFRATDCLTPDNGPPIRGSIRPSRAIAADDLQRPRQPADVLAQFVAAATSAKAAPPPDLDDIPQLSKLMRERALDRIEAGTREGLLDLTCEQMSALLVILFPDEFEVPPVPPRPTDTPPRSPERMRVYMLRVRARVATFHKGDAAGDQEGRAIHAEWKISRSPKVRGWKEEGTPERKASAKRRR